MLRTTGRANIAAVALESGQQAAIACSRTLARTTAVELLEEPGVQTEFLLDRGSSAVNQGFDSQGRQSR